MFWIIFTSTLNSYIGQIENDEGFQGPKKKIVQTFD